jgi:hypothetical protein
MPENGGKGSFDYELRNLLKTDLPWLKWQHNSDSRRADKDWPDWVIGGPYGVLVRELKRMGRKPTRGQQEWLDILAAAGFNVGVWWPCCWYAGLVTYELSGIAYACDTPAWPGGHASACKHGIVDSRAVSPDAQRSIKSPRHGEGPLPGGPATPYNSILGPADAGQLKRDQL